MASQSFHIKLVSSLWLSDKSKNVLTKKRYKNGERIHPLSKFNYQRTTKLFMADFLQNERHEGNAMLKVK